MSEMYAGPIIDAHTHMWDLTGDNYPWLSPHGSFGPEGMLDVLKGKNYLLEDYRRDTTGLDIVASVHIEALWDPSDGKINETRWLESLDKGDNLAIRYVAGVDFATPSTINEIREQARVERVKAIRQTIAWNPDPRGTMTDRPALALDPQWREALPVLVEHGMALELLLFPWQADDVSDLAGSYPELTVIVDHMGSPIDQSLEGVEHWRRGVETMGAHSNVVMKLSAATAYLSRTDDEYVQSFISVVLSGFGTERLMYGSDFPVAGALSGWTYGQHFDVYRRALSHLPAAEQRAIFCDNAARVYDIGADVTGD